MQYVMKVLKKWDASNVTLYTFGYRSSFVAKKLVPASKFVFSLFIQSIMDVNLNKILKLIPYFNLNFGKKS
jgi:hypothetical protein